MLRKIAFLMVFLVAAGSVASAQTATKMDARTLLVELGSMLTEIPESTEQCQALLGEIKVWQEEKLKELQKPKLLINITEPTEGPAVPRRPFVKGTVSDPNAKVWVIVHPMETGNYWVQPSLTPKKDGTWKVMIYIGRPGTEDVGKHFEIMAVANPEKKLKEGDVLSGYPEAKGKTQVIELTRK